MTASQAAPAHGCWTCKSESVIHHSSVSPGKTRRHNFISLHANLLGHSYTGRKIGCDKGRPSCNNCLRTRRKCLGYKIRLAWPDKPDGRRRRAKAPVPIDGPGCHCQESASYGQQFLNVSYKDMEQSRRVLTCLAHLDRPYGRPQPCLTLLPQLQGQELDLLAYCEQVGRVIIASESNPFFPKMNRRLLA